MAHADPSACGFSQARPRCATGLGEDASRARGVGAWVSLQDHLCRVCHGIAREEDASFAVGRSHATSTNDANRDRPPPPSLRLLTRMAGYLLWSSRSVKLSCCAVGMGMGSARMSGARRWRLRHKVKGRIRPILRALRCPSIFRRVRSWSLLPPLYPTNIDIFCVVALTLPL